MGGTQPNNKIQQDQIEHVRLGNVKIEETTSNQQDQQQTTQIIHLKRSVQSQKHYKQWAKSMEQILDSQTQEVLFLPIKQQFVPVGLCGSGGIAQLTFEYYQFALEVEIQNRQKLRKDFLQTQIWYLLYNIVRAGQKFQHFKKKIGNIHPSNILINQNGQVKIISSCSLPGQLNSYDTLIQSLHNKDKIVYLAPQQINNDLIQKGAYPSHVDPCLAEVFSIGLIILSSGTLQKCDNLYNKDPYQFKQRNLNHLLNVFKDKYSHYLFKIVSSMLALNPQQRNRCSQIMTTLAPFEAQIMDLQPFSPPAELNYRPSYPAQRSVNYQQQNVVYNQPVHSSHYGAQVQRFSGNVPQGQYVVYQGGSHQGRPVTYSQPNVVLPGNQRNFR